MAELPDVVRVSGQVKATLEDIKENGGHSSIDSVLRSTLSENENLKIENELLKKKLDECKKGIRKRKQE